MEKPKTVKEAVRQLKDEMSAEDKEYFKKYSQKDLVPSFHDNFGRGIRNRFGLWGDDRTLLEDCYRVHKEEYPEDFKYTEDFYGMDPISEGLPYADEASSVIMKELWKDLNNGS